MERLYKKQVLDRLALQTPEDLAQKSILSIHWHLCSTPEVGNFFPLVSLSRMTVYPLFSGPWKGSTLHFKGLWRGLPTGQLACGNPPCPLLRNSAMQWKVHGRARRTRWTSVSAALLLWLRGFEKVPEPLWMPLLTYKMQMIVSALTVQNVEMMKVKGLRKCYIHTQSEENYHHLCC